MMPNDAEVDHSLRIEQYCFPILLTELITSVLCRGLSARTDAMIGFSSSIFFLKLLVDSLKAHL